MERSSALLPRLRRLVVRSRSLEAARVDASVSLAVWTCSRVTHGSNQRTRATLGHDSTRLALAPSDDLDGTWRVAHDTVCHASEQPATDSCAPV